MNLTMNEISNNKPFSINSGVALFLNDRTEMFSVYDSIEINAGRFIVSRKVYEKLSKMGVSINSGHVEILDVAGEVVELEEETVITSKMSYDGCFLVCDGTLMIESTEGLKNITGLYAESLFRAESVDLSGINGIAAGRQVIYPDGSVLHLASIVLDENAVVTLAGDTPHWVDGKITALDSDALAKLRNKNASFHCKKLVIYTGLYEQYADLFQADSCLLVPDGYAVVEDLTLSPATAPLYGDKIFILDDLMIPFNKFDYLKDFSSIIVNGEVTMPTSAAADFKAVGKAKSFDLYEGTLLTVNGSQTIGHEQLQTAIESGIRYTLRVNGKLRFSADVTAADMAAVVSITINGMVIAPEGARAALDSKVDALNGAILNLEEADDPARRERQNEESEINTGIFKL